MDSRFERVESKEDWITPPQYIQALGKFDLDPCTSHYQNEKYANNCYYIEKDGLSLPWFGRVWCNPPYGTKAKYFIEKMAKHGNGIVLIFARTDTRVWHDHIFPKADAILFVKGRIKFISTEGKGDSPAGAASAFIAYGKENVIALKESGIKGALWVIK